MKICTKCQQEKDLKEFYPKGKRLHAYCKTCFNQYCMDRWEQRHEEALEYKGGRCKKCGYSRCNAALEFHHLDPSKKEMAWIKMRLGTFENMKRELDKCVLLCSNCHREVHMGIAKLD